MKSSWWWRALGGPDATSWPVLLIPIVIALPTTMLNARVWTMPVGEAVLGQVVGAVFMIATLLVARVSWLRPARLARPRSTLVAITFAAASVMRLLGMAGVFVFFDVVEAWPVTVSLISGGVGQAILLCLGSIATNALRSHRRAMTRLDGARGRIAQARSLTIEEVGALQQEVADEVLASARAVIESARHDQDRQRLSDAIQHAALNVVRPASHELHSGDAIAARIRESQRKIRWRSVLSGVRPATPVLGPVIYELLLLGAIWGSYGAEVALLNLVVATPVLILLNLALRRVWRQGMLRRWVIVWLAVAYSFANLVILVVIIGITGVLGFDTADLVVGFGLYPAGMVISGVLVSVVERQDEIEDRLAWAVEEEARAMTQVLRLAEDERRRLAHVMHGQVQAELTAAGAKLSVIDGGDQESTTDVIDSLLARLDSIDITGAQDRRQTLEDLWATWSLAISLDVDVAPEVEALLVADSLLQQRLVVVASEAITNAVRHGVDEGVSIDLSGEDSQVRIEVRNRGTLQTGSSGLGTVEIEQFADSWSVEQEGNEVVFTAAVRSHTQVDQN